MQPFEEPDGPMRGLSHWVTVPRFTEQLLKPHRPASSALSSGGDTEARETQLPRGQRGGVPVTRPHPGVKEPEKGEEGTGLGPLC